MATNTETLKQQIQEVARLRRELTTVKAEREASYRMWEIEHCGLIGAITNISDLLATGEALLRDLTLQAYLETGTKAPMPGVGIRETTELDYNLKQAYEWAVDHEIALKLDVTAFESHAKISPPDFVKVKKVVKATIATDLDKVLPGPASNGKEV